MPPRNLLIKPASGSCNMRCGYCFYSDIGENRTTPVYGMMSLQTLEAVVQKALQTATRTCNFAFQGGEPTLIGLPFYRACIELVKNYKNRGGVHLLNSAGIFKNRVPDTARLLAFGFAETEDGYAISYPILSGQFQMNIKVSPAGAVSVRVLDADSREEYVLVHTPDASGAFVGSVVQACEEKLNIIAEHCFDATVFRSEQAKQIIAYAAQTHQDHPEFLWEKFAGNAVLRRQDNRKWYAALLTVAKTKLGLAGADAVEVIDLRGLPEENERLIDGRRYFPGYHMNKKHWYTICLDGSVSTQEICERIEASYLLAKK